MTELSLELLRILKWNIFFKRSVLDFFNDSERVYTIHPVNFWWFLNLILESLILKQNSAFHSKDSYISVH